MINFQFKGSDTCSPGQIFTGDACYVKKNFNKSIEFNTSAFKSLKLNLFYERMRQLWYKRFEWALSSSHFHWWRKHSIRDRSCCLKICNTHSCICFNGCFFFFCWPRFCLRVFGSRKQQESTIRTYCRSNKSKFKQNQNLCNNFENIHVFF